MAKKMVDECDSDDDMDDVSMVFSITILIDNVLYRPLFGDFMLFISLLYLILLPVFFTIINFLMKFSSVLTSIFCDLYFTI